MDRVPFVGGPKDGETYGWTTAKWVNIPDAREMMHVIYGSGETGTIFGSHTYEMKCYAKDGERLYRLEYVGYEPPKLGAGMRRIVH